MVLALNVLVASFFFFFKQKTAYEMSIGDWSSDVCSSDLTGAAGSPGSRDVTWCARSSPTAAPRSEERRVGKEVNRRVDLGGRRIIKKKNFQVSAMIISDTTRCTWSVSAMSSTRAAAPFLARKALTNSELSSTFFFFKQKTAYEMSIGDWSSDVCSSD